MGTKHIEKGGLFGQMGGWIIQEDYAVPQIYILEQKKSLVFLTLDWILMTWEISPLTHHMQQIFLQEEGIVVTGVGQILRFHVQQTGQHWGIHLDWVIIWADDLRFENEYGPIRYSAIVWRSDWRLVDWGRETRV